MKLYVNVDKPASANKYTWTSEGNHMSIERTDPSYKRDGNYYVSVVPVPGILQKVLANMIKYTYLLTYSTEASYLYL